MTSPKLTLDKHQPNLFLSFQPAHHNNHRTTRYDSSRHSTRWSPNPPRAFLRSYATHLGAIFSSSRPLREDMRSTNTSRVRQRRRFRWRGSRGAKMRRGSERAERVWCSLNALNGYRASGMMHSSTISTRRRLLFRAIQTAYNGASAAILSRPRLLDVAGFLYYTSTRLTVSSRAARYRNCTLMQHI
jgi:hypothetical protein